MIPIFGYLEFVVIMVDSQTKTCDLSISVRLGCFVRRKGLTTTRGLFLCFYLELVVEIMWIPVIVIFL